MAVSLPQSWAEVSSSPRILSCSKTWLSYKSNLVASWIHLHNGRCFLEHLRMLLQSLRALYLAPGGPGSIWNYLGAPVSSVSNGSKFPVRFRTVATGFHQKPGISSLQFSLQLSIWVLTVSWHDQYVDCVVLSPLSPPALTFAIGPIFVESQSKTRTFRPKFHLLSQRFNEYWSNRKSDSGRWKRG